MEHWKVSRADAVRDLGRPVTYYPSLARIVGVRECVFLMQMVYWSTDSKSEDSGWIYKSSKDWELELGLTERQQRLVRDNMKRMGLIDENYVRLRHRMYFRLNWARYNDVLAEAAVLAKREAEGGSDRKVNGEPHTPEAVTEKSEAVTKTPDVLTEKSVGVHRVPESTAEKKNSSNPLEEDEDISSSQAAPGESVKGPLPDPQDSSFPRRPNSSHPDWGKGIELYDLDNAKRIAALFPASGQFWQDNQLARQYYKSRLSGRLPASAIQLLETFYRNARSSVLEASAWRFRDVSQFLGTSGGIGNAIAACRETVEDEINSLRTYCDTLSVDMHMFPIRLAWDARSAAHTTNQTYPLDDKLKSGSVCAELAVAWADKDTRAAAWIEKLKSQIAAELAESPALLKHCVTYKIDPVGAWGFTSEEIYKLQRDHIEPYENKIKELTKLL